MNINDVLKQAKAEVTEGDGLIAALPERKERELIIKFVDEFVETKKPDKDMLKTAKNLIKIAKTFYEFGVSAPVTEKKDGAIVLKKREKVALTLVPRYLKDSDYDKVLAHYKKFEEEPMPYIPAGRDRIDISDERLANNLKKSYIVYDGDPIPNGVSEKLSIERMIKDSYSELNLDKNDEMEVEVSPKIDGVSVNTGVKNEKFKKPATRGDKNQGVHIKALEGFKPNKNGLDDLRIQMEAFMTDEQIKAAEKILGTTYVTGRHSISGIINSMTQSNKDEFDELARLISFYPIESDSSESYSKRIEELDKIAVVPKDMIPRTRFKGTRKEILEFIKKKYKEYSELRPTLSYGIDGIVITIVGKSEQKKLGRDGFTNNYQVALKFSPETAKGIARDITYSAGDKGYRTPMLELVKPVVIDGVEYDKAMIKTLKDIEALAIREGDEVKIVRTGDVIPSISIDGECKRNPSGRLLGGSTNCSYCSSKLEIVNSKYRCTAPACPGNLIGRIKYFLETIGLEGFERAFAEEVVNAKLVENLRDLFKITEDQLNKIGYKKKAKLFISGLPNAMSKLREHDLLAAIGIDQVGTANSKLIASIAPLKELIRMDKDILEYRLRELNGIGDTSAKLFAKGIKEMSSEILILSEKINKERIDYAAAKVVGFTGMEADKVLKELIDGLGWTITSGKNFDILITSSYKRDKGKMEKAKEIGAPIFTKEDFLKEYKK